MYQVADILLLETPHEYVRVETYVVGIYQVYPTESSLVRLAFTTQRGSSTFYVYAAEALHIYTFDTCQVCMYSYDTCQLCPTGLTCTCAPVYDICRVYVYVCYCVYLSSPQVRNSCYSAVHSDVKYKVHSNSYDTCQVSMIHARHVLRSAAARVPLCTSVVSVVYTTINSTSVHIIYSTQLMLYQCPC